MRQTVLAVLAAVTLACGPSAPPPPSPAPAPTPEVKPAPVAEPAPAPAPAPAEPAPAAKPAPVVTAPAPAPAPKPTPTPAPAPAKPAPVVTAPAPAPEVKPAPAPAPAPAEPAAPASTHAKVGVAKCKMCHKLQFTSWEASKHPAKGVDCEACHGNGGDYWTSAVMKDRARAIAAGLVLPTAASCKKCHPAADAALLAKAHAHKGG